MSSSPMGVSESWNRSGPRDNNVMRGSGGILEGMRDNSVESGGSVTRRELCTLVSLSVRGPGSGNTQGGGVAWSKKRTSARVCGAVSGGN